MYDKKISYCTVLCCLISILLHAQDTDVKYNKNDKPALPDAEIPTSSIKIKSATLESDVDGTNILSFDKTSVIVGLHDRPYSVIANPGFDPLTLPTKLQEELRYVVAVDLRLPFALKESDEFYPIPRWIYDLDSLRYLTMNYFKLDKSFFESNLSLECLILNSLREKDKDIVLGNISSLPGLVYLVHTNLFAPDEVAAIQKKAPNLKVLLESEFDDMIEKGKILMP